MELKKSIGHLVFNDVYEYIKYGNLVYRAPINADISKNIDIAGIRMNAVFYCTWNSWYQSPIMREQIISPIIEVN